MASTELTCAASSLLVPLFDAAPTCGPTCYPAALTEVARTRVSVHYETGHAAVPVLSVCTPGAIRLPNSLLVSRLPHPESSVTIRSWSVARWWRPSRPRRVAFQHVPGPTGARDVLSCASLIGRGPGLTPAGDDVVAAALVTAYALRDVRRDTWIAQTREALDRRRTTAVSQAMLHHAMDGYATPQLTAYVDAAIAGAPQDDARRDLLQVGHTSGAALLRGVVHTLSTHQQRGAA